MSRRARWALASMALLTATVATARGAFEVFQPSIVRGASMRPSLADGDRIVVERVTPMFGSLARNDVIVLEPPGTTGERYVKRIAGLPGDVISMGEGELRINGECYRSGILTNGPAATWVVPEQTYFVVGDNADHSFDSRLFGPVPESSVIGRVIGQ